MQAKHLFILSFFIVLSFNCFAQEDFKITHGPYLQNLSDSSVVIIWTTNRPAMSWVELAPEDSSHFYKTARPKYFATLHGIKNVSSVHSVNLEGLKPTTRYRYRIYSKEVLSHEGFKIQYGNTVATNVYGAKPLTFTTSNQNGKSISFLVVNDIHGKNDLLTNLLKIGDYRKTDMVFFNGDMANDLRDESQMFTNFMDTAIKVFAKEKPMFYARGNHETRGQFATEFYKYFPGVNGNLYYLLRQGPVCFVVMDCGEDKPDSDIEYSDITAYEEYRTKQAQWLKAALKSKIYQYAPYKVAIIHMPPFGGWFGEQEIADKFVPILNEGGIQVMLCGHLHRYVNQKPQPGLNQFPVIANSNNMVLKGEANEKELKIQVINLKGETIDNILIPNK